MTSTIAMWAALEIARAIAWPDHKTPGEMVINSQGEMASVWIADGGKEEKLPAVDFNQNTVLAVFAGEQAGGSVQIQSIHQIRASQEYEVGSVIVLYRNIAGKATGKPKYPSAVVVVKKIESQVRFVDVDSEEGQILSGQQQKVQAAEKNLIGTDRPDRFKKDEQ